MTRSKRIWSVLTAIAVAFAAAGCDSNSPDNSAPPASSAGGAVDDAGQAGAASPSAPPRPTAVDLAAVDMANPEAVAEATVRTSMLWDSATDMNEFDAIRRATSLMTADLAAQFAPVEHPAADGMWSDARQMNAYSVPQIHTAQPTHDAPIDTPSTVYRVYDATWIWVGDGGEVLTDPRTRYLYLTVVLQDDGRWLVSTFDFSDI